MGIIINVFEFIFMTVSMASAGPSRVTPVCLICPKTSISHLKDVFHHVLPLLLLL